VEATRWSVEDCPPAFRIPAVLTALPLWAKEDPQAALAAVSEWEKWRSDVREVLQIGLVRGWYDRDPEEAARYIAEKEAGLGQQRALSTYVRVLTQRKGAEATMRWAESVSEDVGEGAYKLAVYRQVGGALPLFDHQAALRWCDAHCDGRFGNNLRSIIARRWALYDGAAALAWLKIAPESHERKVAVRLVFSIGGNQELDAALAWMAAQPRGEDGDLEPWIRPAIPVYARLLARSAPLEAIAWAERIEDEEEREIVLVDVVRIWRNADVDAAEAWLGQSSLSEEAREKARKPKPLPGAPPA
jgi:hypothetical protein